MAFGGKTVFLFIGFALFIQYLQAQQKITDYNSRWKIIDSLINKKGLTQSALEETLPRILASDSISAEYTFIVLQHEHAKR